MQVMLINPAKLVLGVAIALVLMAGVALAQQAEQSPQRLVVSGAQLQPALAGSLAQRTVLTGAVQQTTNGVLLQGGTVGSAVQQTLPGF